MLQILFEQFSF